MFHGLGRQNVRGTDGSLDFFMVTSAPSSILCFCFKFWNLCPFFPAWCRHCWQPWEAPASWSRVRSTCSVPWQPCRRWLRPCRTSSAPTWKGSCRRWVSDHSRGRKKLRDSIILFAPETFCLARRLLFWQDVLLTKCVPFSLSLSLQFSHEVGMGVALSWGSFLLWFCRMYFTAFFCCELFGLGLIELHVEMGMTALFLTWGFLDPKVSFRVECLCCNSDSGPLAFLAKWKCLRMAPDLLCCVDHWPFMRLGALAAWTQMTWLIHILSSHTLKVDIMKKGTSASEQLSRFFSKERSFPHGPWILVLLRSLSWALPSVSCLPPFACIPDSSSERGICPFSSILIYIKY